MNPRVLPKDAWRIVRQLGRHELLKDWILAGGTGLALQLGHRVSLDLDFFREEPFDPQQLRRSLSEAAQLEVLGMDASTLHARLDGIHVSYLESEVPFLFPTTEYRDLRLADPRDIAAMKVIAIGGRGSRKDFVDLYAYLEAGGTFPDLLRLVRERHADTEFNEMHLLKSLVYFEDAESEPMPRMLTELNWPEIRGRIEDEVRRWAP